MKYFLLDHSIAEEEVGPYPQSTGMANDYPYKEKDSVWKIDYDTTIAPNLNSIKLEKSAVLTDLLSSVVINDMIGKIVSEGLKNLLEQFELPGHRFFEANVIDHKNRPVTSKKYYLFRLLEHQNRYIDFDKSEFYVHRIGNGEVRRFEAERAEDFEGSTADLGIGEHIKPKFICLLPDARYDIFSFRRFSGFFVSERLKVAIETACLTGIHFESADFIMQKDVILGIKG